MKNQNPFLDEINHAVNQFDAISLQEMDGVKLMDRVDVKYMIPLYLLSSILNEVKPYYRLLEIENKRLAPYKTLYFDTEDLSLYHNHHAGRLNRYKIRFRNYVNSNVSYFEIKHKNNKGRTLKTRIEQPNEIEEALNNEKRTFLEKSTPLQADLMKGNFWVHYERITLVNKTSAERLTIDINLKFLSKTQTVDYQQFAIAEVKRNRIGASPIIDILRSHQLKEGSISKYCLGVISIFKEVKFNRFKEKITHLQKIIHQYDSFTGTNPSRDSQTDFSMAR
jgi:VTC domain